MRKIENLSRIAKKYDSVDSDCKLEQYIDSKISRESNLDKKKVKCDCCNQTQFFMQDNILYIKCVRCKTERKIKILDITNKSSELKV